MDYAHAMDWPNSQYKIGQVCFGVLFFQVALLLQQLPETASATVVQNEEIEVV